MPNKRRKKDHGYITRRGEKYRLVIYDPTTKKQRSWTFSDKEKARQHGKKMHDELAVASRAGNDRGASCTPP